VRERKAGCFARGLRRFSLRSAPCLLLFAVCSVLAAQSRDIPIYLPAAEGGTDEQRQYFFDNFKMELEGAKYPVVDSIGQSQYSLPLTVSDNPYAGQEGEEQFVLTIALVRTKDNAEIVRFEFPFTDLQKMYEWNLFLVYRTMGNAVAYYDYEAEGTPAEQRQPAAAPAAEPAPKPQSDGRWRNQWLYAAGSVGADFGYYVQKETGKLSLGIVMPVVSVGAEYHFLNFMSAEADVKLRLLYDGVSLVYSPALALMIKGVWKPYDVLMIEPYAGLEGALGIGGEVPWLYGIWGVQLGFKNGERGAITLDIGGVMSLAGSFQTTDGKTFGLMRVCIAVGYKYGWFDRKF
jgi:hypothetical protein